MGPDITYMRVHIHAMRSVHAIVDRAARGCGLCVPCVVDATCMQTPTYMRYGMRSTRRAHAIAPKGCNAMQCLHEDYVRYCVFHRRVTWVHILEPGTYASILAREDVQCYW
jgi:hypothetical protein